MVNRRQRRVPVAKHWAPLLAALLACSCAGQVEDSPTLFDADGRAGTDAPNDPSVPSIAQPPDSLPPFAPAASSNPRLTTTQFSNALDTLLGPGAAPELQADTRPYLFSNIGAGLDTLSEHGVESMMDASLARVTSVFGDPSRRSSLVGCQPQVGDTTCTQSFLRDFMRRAWRRPAEEAELSRYVALSSSVGSEDAWTGVLFATAAVLSSPNFIYRIELGEPDPDAPGYRYTAYELAARMAFFLWDDLPDGTLLDAAQSGALHDEQALRAQVKRMLRDPRAQRGVEKFFSEYFSLGGIESIAKSPEHFPDFTPELGASMRKEVEDTVRQLLVIEGRPLVDILSTRETMVDARMAEYYGLEADETGRATHPADGPRAGLLTMSAILTMRAHAQETSPTRRGILVRQQLLCQSVPEPPMNIELDLDDEQAELGPDATLREKLKRHREDPQCAGCHALMDPIGLGLEDFDAVGAHRTTEGERAIDASGELDGVYFEGGRQLGELLRYDPRVPACIARQMYRYAASRLETSTEAASLAAIERDFNSGIYGVEALSTAIITSDAFRKTEAP